MELAERATHCLGVLATVDYDALQHTLLSKLADDRCQLDALGSRSRNDQYHVSG
jgi:hypothetical protein